MKLRTIFRMIKPFLGAVDVKIDRTRQIITLQKNGQTESFTVDQLYDEIEGIFTEAKPAAAQTTLAAAQTTLDPFGGGTIDRIEAPWLSECREPIVNPWARL